MTHADAKVRIGEIQWFLRLAALSAFSLWCQLNAQTPAQPGTRAIQACTLLSQAEVEKVTGRRMYDAPQPMSLRGGAGSSCSFDEAQLVIFSGERSEELWNGFVKTSGHEKAEKHPVSGIGNRAYAFYPKPRDQYEDTSAFVVVNVGQHTIGVSVAAPKGKPAESVQPQAMALAKIVVAKLR